jgi:hypothetical protein
MSLAEDQYVIQAFSADAAQKSLADRVRPWRARWRPDHSGTNASGSPVEVRTVPVVAVPDHEPRTCRDEKFVRDHQAALR